MNYWLMKSEPDAFSIDDLAALGQQTEPWDGIRNYQARNFMRDDMRVGDQAFFYHSSCKYPGIMGVMTIASDCYADPTAWDPTSKYYDPKSTPEEPRWWLRDVRFKAKFPRVIDLAKMKSDPQLADMRLLRKGNRLSIMPIDELHWQHIMSLL